MDDCKLFPPEGFPFPFEPYSIQLDFMKSLYAAIEGKKIGIFESPTGTGKSLSLICGSLTWLRDHEDREESRINKLLEDSKHPSHSSNSLDWIQDFEDRQALSKDVEDAKQVQEERLKRKTTMKMIKNKTGSLDVKSSSKVYRKKRKQEDETLAIMEKARKEIESYKHNTQNNLDDNMEDLVPKEYESHDEDEESNKWQTNDEDHMTRIYFCSRTHSQLSQFVNELKKSPFGKSLSTEKGQFTVTVTTLASRNSLCVNEAVRKLKSLQLINDRCLEMQKNANRNDKATEQPKKRRKVASTGTCCYYSNNEGISDLTETIVRDVHDIEDVVKQGKSIEACPYYATRRSISLCQLVVLPYQTLLHRSTREASGIRLKDSVIIVDEAHNLVEAMNSMYSVRISGKCVTQARNQLIRYQQKFIKRLKAKNLFYVNQLIFVVKRLQEALAPSKEKKTLTEKLFTINDFLFHCSLDNINFFKLLKYCKRSQIAKKISGFVEKCEAGIESASSLSTFLKDVKNSGKAESPGDSKPPPSHDDVTMRSPLLHVESFIGSLTSCSRDARVAVTSTNGEAGLKFLLLNPSLHFKDILDDCRSLIVAGGTMQPSSCLVDQLLAHAETSRHRSRIVEFSCGHVIDGAAQLLPLALSSGPSGEAFEFTFEKRGNPKMIDEVGRTLLNLCNLVPGGVVCFFPSYDYENTAHRRWSEAGLLTRIEAKKKVFREPKRSDRVEQILAEYSKCIERTSDADKTKVNGAILLSVVGGKMSEGINFSDDMGRCVVMVGLPYPNLHSLELKEKMDYLTKNMPPDKDGRTGGQVHYEDLCMKAVNQSIGRAIRHRADYACILLLDRRYQKASVSGKLPSWIAAHLQQVQQFGKACVAVRKFFRDKET